MRLIAKILAMMTEKLLLFRIFTIVSGLFALVSILVGLFAPAWIVFDMRITPGGRGPVSKPPPPPQAVSDKFGLPRTDRKSMMGPTEHSSSTLDHHRKLKLLKLLGLNIKTSAHIGLWTVSACVDTGGRIGEQCMSMSMERFAQSLTQSNTAGNCYFKHFISHSHFY